ncbi:glycosyl transferase family 2 [Streptantibioticus cattleyicolor NRRL 8057 = DSM 46488]|uniref:Glycosyl transferase family 2 n=1 Tax=Streptantibioticus cattleyicolor (strain ATCC 35852 / DSM 46488 / JCM 4925 / NBRC 14057 / NRRL 8057) TaxID=1003195 RepID=G8WWI6_STREN|nr:glycosyl transferase family 2 [Streptantibioticus cattleyicolor NRRL 8057 = DSM 46488]
MHSHQGAYSAQPPAYDGYDAGQGPSPAVEFPRHVVTAVLVAHDGARWLPDALAGLLGQHRPVQQVVAADTGSTDDTPRLLTEALGADRVVHLARRAGFGSAVAEAVRAAGPAHPAGAPNGEPVQWLWLLHDDCEPAPDALAELLRVADTTPSAAVVGPKLRSWYDRRALLEVGVSIARGGRRWTGLERREQDQGQHDQVRQVLAVSSAGMLVRRDVWDRLGGFDRRLPLMRDDTDFCWRVNAAGHRVLVAPDAVLRHAEAASRERRAVDCGGRTAGRPTGAADTGTETATKRFALRGPSPHRVDKAGAVYTLLANTRGAALPYVTVRIILSTLLRTLGLLVGKVPGQALDEVTGLLGVLLRPGRILAARRQRGKPAISPAELRALFPPHGATVRATVEQLLGNVAGRAEADTSSAGRHGGAVESGPGDDDAEFLDVEQFARLKRVAHKPGPVLFAVLLLASLIACRGLLGGGSLMGGALLPAPDGAHDLWGAYAGAWHAVGTGTVQAAPPYLAALALLSSVLFGSTSLTLTVLLVASVPLAGISAYFASRPLVASRLLRAWAAVAYAFLPAATGALAGGRIGTAMLAVLLPLMARCAVAAAGLQLSAAAVDRGLRPTWRATWGLALLLTATTAFTPVVWPLAAVLSVLLLVAHLVRGRRALLLPQTLRLLWVLATPLIVLAPWSLTLLEHPSFWLREAGLPYRGGTASGLDLLMLSPGGPKAGAGFLLVGLVLAALAAPLRRERRTAVLTAWAVALTALLAAAGQNHTAWAGPATLVYGLALLAAAVVGAEGARERISASGFGWRQPVAVLIALAAGAAPLIAAVTWTIGGAAGPLQRRDPTQVPAFVAEESSTRDQARTLVLDGDPGHVTYSLVRGSGARIGDAEITAEAGRDPRLDAVVGNLVAGSGGDQAGQLGGYAIRYVLLRPGAPAAMSRILDATPGLNRLSQSGGTALWRVSSDVARITITAPSGSATAPVTVAAGKVEAHTTIPSGPDGRVLRIADTAAPGWQATLDGKPLTPVTVDGWAQGFRLPADGGRFDLVYHEPLAHTLWLPAQGFLALVMIVLALPGRRRDVDDDLPEETAAEPLAIPAQPVAGEGRRARRLRAAAEAAEAADPTRQPAPGTPAAPPAPEPEPAPAPEPYPAPQYGDAQPYTDPYAYPYPQQQPDPYTGYPGDGGYQGYQDGGYQGYQEPYPPPEGYPDPYGYQQPGPAAAPYDPHGYDPAYGAGDPGSHHRDGSDQQ